MNDYRRRELRNAARYATGRFNWGEAVERVAFPRQAPRRKTLMRRARGPLADFGRQAAALYGFGRGFPF